MEHQTNKSGYRRFFDEIIDKIAHLKSPQIIMWGYVLVILAGTILLMLPISSKAGVVTNPIDALFTATSATCVTGLTVYNTLSYWSSFGHLIILLLIQIGGMGFMTIITMFLVFLKKKITLKERLVIQDSLNQNDLRGLVRLVKNIFIWTLVVEGAAAVILGIKFMIEEGTTFFYGLWLGVFHSVSAFNNAGFDILGDESLGPYVGDPIVNIVIMLLIISGGLGYGVWIDIFKVGRLAISGQVRNVQGMFNKLSLHSKLVMEITVVLIAVGAIFFFIIEFSNPHTMGNLSIFEKIWASLFQSVSPRTAGYATVDQGSLTPASQFMTVILMIIGGSPGGTAGGIKTVTMGVLFLSVFSIVKGRDDIVVHHKKINTYFLKKSLLVIMLNLVVIVVAILALSITERHNIGADFMAILFEVTSAVGTVGLTVGLTPDLTEIGKIIITICMFIGRVGPITVAVAITMKGVSGGKGIHYPDEKIYVG